MRRLLATTLQRLARWLHPKAIPFALTGPQWTGTSYVDAYQRNRQPSPNELLAELKGAAWTCASINAATCANFAPRLYVATHPSQPAPKCLTRQLDPLTEQRLRSLSTLPPRHTKAAQIEEVLDHPLLTLLQQVNPVHNSFDLWELTTLYQEVHGSAYWSLNFDRLGVPREIWLLPSQNVTPYRDPDSRNLVDSYVYRTGQQEQRFAPREIIHFRYPDPRNPYTGGLSPLRACFEQVALMSDYAAMKKAIYENNAVPAAVVSPEEVIGEEERDRLETQWNSKFRRGGSGRVVVGESTLRVQVLSHSMGDLAALADMQATKEDVANAFHVPIAFLTTQTNLANLQAAEHQHQAKAIGPRLTRRDEKLNEQLVPLFDPTGRLFLASDDPVPSNRDYRLRQQESDLKYGVITINEVRQERGLAPVAWGNTPWLPLGWAPSDYDRAEAYPDTGRNRKPEEENP
jgi:HK97 family phage portal protein